MNFAHCLQIVSAIGKYRYFSRGRFFGEGGVGGSFHGGIFHDGRELSIERELDFLALI